MGGERDLVKYNKSLGNFRLDGIPPAPRGVPKIEVRFDIDANCILSVTATDKGTAKKADIKITGASTLATEDVERMVKEAERFAEEDKKKREAIDTKNQGDSLVYQTRKQLAEFGEKIPNDLKENVENKKEVTNIGQVLYTQQDTKTAEQGVKDVNEKEENKNKDDVIDADVADKEIYTMSCLRNLKNK